MELGSNSSADRSGPVTRPKKQRSKVTNGRARFVVGGDGRSPWTRRWVDLIEAHVADMGGTANLSEAQRSLIKRASTLECELEAIEGKLSEGKAQDLAAYATVAAHLRRLLETLGIARVARNMGNVIDGTAVESSWSPLRQRLHAEAAAREYVEVPGE